MVEFPAGYTPEEKDQYKAWMEGVVKVQESANALRSSLSEACFGLLEEWPRHKAYAKDVFEGWTWEQETWQYAMWEADQRDKTVAWALFLASRAAAVLTDEQHAEWWHVWQSDPGLVDAWLQRVRVFEREGGFARTKRV